MGSQIRHFSRGCYELARHKTTRFYAAARRFTRIYHSALPTGPVGGAGLFAVLAHGLVRHEIETGV